jgi:RNA polymerase subunit RPABC4/transcription elongation factor Spt4
MFCKYCGVTISNDSVFCHNCGRELFVEEGKSIINQRLDNTAAASVNTAAPKVNAQPAQSYAVHRNGETTYNNLPQGGVAYNNIPTSGGTYDNTVQGGVAYNNTVQGGVAYNNVPQGSVVYNTLPGRDMTGINTNAAKVAQRPDIRVCDGFFFRHLDKKNEFLLKLGAAVIALWTAAAVVMIFFPQYTNLL